MKKYLYSLIAVFILTFSFTSPADAFEYSTSVKATFMQGCIFDDPPDFNNNSAVFIKLKRCICMLDKFEKRYTEKQFIDLFEHAEKNYSWQKRELDDFVKETMPGCL